jgi:hypothetical protein
VGSGMSLITFAVSFGIVAVYWGSLVALCLADVPSGIGAQTTVGIRSSAGWAGEFLFWRRGFLGGGLASERQKQQIFAENVTKCWRTAREGCILVPLCPESFLGRD